jgi:hypothetical protein
VRGINIGSWGHRPPRPRYRSRPKWGGIPSPSWDPNYTAASKRKRIPRAFSRRAEWAHSDTALEKRNAKLLGVGDRARSFGLVIEGLLTRLGIINRQDNFRPDPPPNNGYTVEV